MTSRLRGVRVCVVLLLLGAWLGGMACGKVWAPPLPHKDCDLPSHPLVKLDPYFKQTLGANDQRARGCLRVAWGDKATQGHARWVEVDASGQVLAWSPETKAFVPDLSVTLPTEAKGKSRRFSLFLFGATSRELSASQQQSLCEETMAKPTYPCDTRAACWLQLDFRPRNASQSGNPDADRALIPSCTLRVNGAPATEPAPEETQDASPERRAEVVPERECQEGEKRICSSPQPGECAKGMQTCTGGVWRACLAPPAGAEVCDGKDNDCDGSVDESFPDSGKKCVVTGNKGPCAEGVKRCQGGKETCLQDIQPVTEKCDGIDNDCDGDIDEGCCKETNTRPCYSGPAGTENQGTCRGGTQTCKDGKWGACLNEIVPRQEQCDQQDDDCDGKIDNNCTDPCPVPCVTTIAGPPLKRKGPAAYPWLDKPSGLVSGGAGFYVSDAARHRILLWLDSGGNMVHWTLGAGRGYRDGKAAQARFDQPHGLALGPRGDLFIADYGNKKIRKMTPLGDVSTVQAFTGLLDGPKGIAVDKNGVIYVTDTDSHSILFGKETGPIKRIGKRGAPGSTDGPPANVRFRSPHGIAVGLQNFVFVVDTGNHVIRSIDPTRSDVGTVTGRPGSPGMVDSKRGLSRFNSPIGIAIDGSGHLYIGDAGNNRIRKVDPQNVTTVAGGSTAGQTSGPTNQASLSGPEWVSLRGSGSSLVIRFTEPKVPMVRRMSIVGGTPTISLIIGAPVAGKDDGVAEKARFRMPLALHYDAASGDIYIADSGNFVIRKLGKSGSVNTFSGGGTRGNTKGGPLLSRFDTPSAITAGEQGGLYVVDQGTHHMRIVKANGATALLAGGGTSGYKNGDRGPSRFHSPTGGARFVSATVDNVYVADSANHCIRKIDLKRDRVSTLAGKETPTGCEQGYADGAGRFAKFSAPAGVAVDSAGNLYVSEHSSQRIRKITPAGVVSTFAGNGKRGYLDGPALSAQFATPSGLAVDGAGNVYVADTDNHAIRKIDTNGNVTTVVGNCTPSQCFSGFFDGPSDVAMFKRPTDLVIDAAGNLLIVDSNNHRIRKVQLK